MEREKYICNICPRKCNAERSRSAGFCNQKKLKVALVTLHKFEEPIISAGKGSGAIFFSGCNMRCVYCQNMPISRYGKGKIITVKKLVKIFKRLEKLGANNINLVTPTHFTREIMQALDIYRPKIPIVWNSSGYEDENTIKMLKNYVDIFLVDLKYCSNDLALKYSSAPNYFSVATKAILQMKANQPKNIIKDGLMKKGLIVRHLVLPTHTTDSVALLDWIAKFLGTDTIVSIMSQFEPKYVPDNYPELKNKITPLEYKRVVSYALKLNLKNAYTQELSSADTKYTPKF